MTKKDNFLDESSRVDRSFRRPEKGRGKEKQKIERYVKEWNSFDDWSDESVDTFQKFQKRGSR